MERSAASAGVLLWNQPREDGLLLFHPRGGTCCHFCRSSEKGKRGCCRLPLVGKAFELWDVPWEVNLGSKTKREAEFLTLFPPIPRRQGTWQPHLIIIARYAKTCRWSDMWDGDAVQIAKNLKHHDAEVKNHLNTQLWKTAVAASGWPRVVTHNYRKAACLRYGDKGENTTEGRSHASSSPRWS